MQRKLKKFLHKTKLKKSLRSARICFSLTTCVLWKTFSLFLLQINLLQIFFYLLHCCFSDFYIILYFSVNIVLYCIALYCIDL